MQKGSLIKVSTINCNCINNFEKKIRGIHSKKEETKMSQTKGKQHLMDLNKTVNFICKKIDEFERDRVEKEEIIDELQKNVNNVSATIENLKGSLDRQEQSLEETARFLGIKKREYG